MDNVDKFDYWQDIAQYDLDTADAMYQTGRYLYPPLTGSKTPHFKFSRETKKISGGQLPVNVRFCSGPQYVGHKGVATRRCGFSLCSLLESVGDEEKPPLIGVSLYVVFMCQQAIEKLTKGLHVLKQGEEAPRTHNIYTVFKKVFDSKQKDEAFREKEQKYAPFFAELLAYYISDRYPSYREKLSITITREKAEAVLKQSKEVFAWLTSLQKL